MTAKFYSLVLLLAATSVLTGCGGGNSDSRSLYPAPYYKVTRENFISGKRFCQLYNNVGGKEYGKYVTVPKDYSNPSKGSIEVYAYSYKPVNPKLPTYIFVDGGPGQNTHGFAGVLNGEANELKFDQRGLGCSTPNSFDEYFDATLYSTENTARDMDEIRKAYGLAKWSVYGVSYGSQPATVYSSMFSDNLNSVVLEGVTSLPQLAHAGNYKAEKWNLVLDTLNSTQRDALRELIFERSGDDFSADAETVWGLFMESSFIENGLQRVANYLQRLIAADGTINRSMLQASRNDRAAADNFPTTQRPRAVDRNVQYMIDCKEFSLRTIPTGNVTFNYYANRFVESDSSKELAQANQACDEVGASASDLRPYVVNNYPIAKPIYYFQGSHDGATMALGAFEHWKTVPRAGSTFMLAKRGGHTPAMARMRKQPETKAAQQSLFLRAINSQTISEDHVRVVNDLQPDQFDWVLFANGFDSSALSFLTGM